MAPSGIDPLMGILGVFSPRRYWMSKLSDDFPGRIAAPCLPPFSTPRQSPTENDPAGVAPPWQEAQLACKVGRIFSRKMDSFLSAASTPPAAASMAIQRRKPAIKG